MKLRTRQLKKVISPLVKNGYESDLLMQNYIHPDSSIKIVIADDDPAIIDVLTLMLETVGYQVYASGNGQTMADITRICPDLILLDILMSGINGYSICKKLKAQQSTKHIPVIMISANKDAKEIASEAHADDFISKPFEMYGLLQKIAKYIKV